MDVPAHPVLEPPVHWAAVEGVVEEAAVPAFHAVEDVLPPGSVL